MLFILIAAGVFAGTYALSAWRILSRYGALACAAFGGAILLLGLNAIHWHISWVDVAALTLTVAALAMALSMHRWRTLARNRAFA